MTAQRRSRTWLWVVLAGLGCGGVSYFYGARRPALQQEATPQMRPWQPPGTFQSPGASAPFPIPPRGGPSGMPGLPLQGGRIIAAVDLNSAPLSQLETLPGMTADYARKIVAGRPFRTLADVERIGIPSNILQAMSPPAMIRSTGGGQPPAAEAPRQEARP